MGGGFQSLLQIYLNESSLRRFKETKRGLRTEIEYCEMSNP